MQLQQLQIQFLQDLASSETASTILSGTNTYLQNGAKFKAYQDNYLNTLLKALAQRYPVTERLLGEDCFRGLAKRYIQLHPSYSKNLQEYGADLSQFMVAQAIVKRDEFIHLPYLVEIIHFETIVEQVFFAAPNSLFDFQAFASIDPTEQGDLIFCLGEHCQTVSSWFPLDRIWELNHSEEAVEEILDLSELPSEPYIFMLWRPDFDVRILRLTPAHKNLLRGLTKKLSLRQLYVEVILEEEKAELNLALAQFIQLGCITRFKSAITTDVQ